MAQHVPGRNVAPVGGWLPPSSAPCYGGAMHSMRTTTTTTTTLEAGRRQESVGVVDLLF